MTTTIIIMMMKTKADVVIVVIIMVMVVIAMMIVTLHVTRHTSHVTHHRFDAEAIAPLSKAFSVIMLAGGFGVVIIGPILDKWGIAWGFVVTFATGTLWSVLGSVPSIMAQGLSWGTFALYRAFFFSVIASYM